ncbi:MAG: helix-turn-helix domain-containing protein [Kineosporiaceae bacterium]
MTHAEPDAALLRLRRNSGKLATAAAQRMDESLPWFRAKSAQDRSWVGLVAQAGIAAFISWFEKPGTVPAVTSDVFGTAPRELTRSISLQQTLELVRVVVDVVEDHVEEISEPGAEQMVRESVLRYSREVAFAAAMIYAQAAEARGAWDARLEALVVDALVRGEADDGVRSRAAALGWPGDSPLLVVAGSSPVGTVAAVVEDLRRAARAKGGDALVGVQGDRVVAVVGRHVDPTALAAHLTSLFGPGPVVTGPVVPHLDEAGRSAQAALAGLAAAPAWPAAPRPVAADDLLPERLMCGDDAARQELVERAYQRLADVDAPLLETAATYLDLGRSLEATARALFVHPNTVRYRLKRVADVSGWDPTEPREAFVLQVAIAVGRLSRAGRRGARETVSAQATAAL